MGIRVISSHILVESRAVETDEQFSCIIEAMVVAVYGHRPDWLQFSAGRRFVRAHHHFREFVCLAGSVVFRLMRHARRIGDFQRAIIYRVEDDGVERAFEIHAGVETEFNPDELQIAQHFAGASSHRACSLDGEMKYDCHYSRWETGSSGRGPALER